MITAETDRSAQTLVWRQQIKDHGMELYEFNDATTVRTMLQFGREWIAEDDEFVAALERWPEEQERWVFMQKATRAQMTATIKELEEWLVCKGLTQ